MVNRAEKRRQKKLAQKQAKQHGKASSPQNQTVTVDQALQLALEHHQAGRLQDAESIYRQILQAQPNHHQALNFLGMIAHATGNYDAALDLIGKALGVKPDDAHAHCNKGIVLNSLGRKEEACTCFETSLKFAPHEIEVAFNLGTVLKDLKRDEEACVVFQDVLKKNPRHVPAMNNLGLCLIALNKPGEALQWFDKILGISPDFHNAYFNKGLAHWHNDDLEIAEALMKNALKMGLDPSGANATLGQVCQTDGRIDEAVSYLREAIRLKPDYGKAHMNLARLIKVTSANEDVRAMKAAYDGPIADLDDKIALSFALGKVHEDLGEYERSFQFYTEGNALKRGTFHLDFEHQFDDLNAIQKTFTPKFHETFSNTGSTDPTPVFIVGMPRSGTTLVEQIISAHPSVFGAGELYALEEVVRSHFGSFHDVSEGFSAGKIHPDKLAQAGADYIDRLRQHDEEALHITDKMPANFANIGMIKLMLPNAKVIHCRRDPYDTGLSLYKTFFSNTDVSYSYDLAEIGAYYKLYTLCMQHWQNVLPGFVYHVDYEDLIDNQDTCSRALVSHIGLDWDDACLQFYKSNRTVKTASLSQVRQPIYKDSVQKWKRFEPWLAPLVEALED
ncbi:sulfotransferase [Magnetovibrio sp. PR-2]|uniref:sulfotransferase n=1 Tax=Magnetovibrio sp. PR-2 TaxID=3120356 RepID=UPI002FCDFA7C